MQNNNKIIIGLVGEKGSGKDTIADYLIDHYQALMLGGGDIIRKILGLLHMEISRENLSKTADSIRQTFGENVFQDALILEIQKSNHKICVISGVRKPSEIEQLKSIGAKIWYITAPVELRFERVSKRHQNDDDNSQTLELFKQQEKLNTERFIEELGKTANTIIENIGSEQELITKVDQEMIKLLS